jgi:hypothetical protein
MGSEKHTSDIGLGIGSMLSRADMEIEKLKRGHISYKSKYWNKKENKYNYNTFTDDIGNPKDWIEAYNRFCNKTINVHGKPTNRKHLLNHNFKPDNWFKKRD